MRNSIDRLILFGASLALITLLLKYVEYRFFVGSMSTEFYTAFIALLFTLVGLFIGKGLLHYSSEKIVTPSEKSV
ncbi:MAG: hypothetical protein AAFU67_17245, partial [Bacteroidota bacterium]